ncbi:LytR/AlgR family response regulator transcription factor [Chryseobacterium gambrini]|uniref:LytR/AlgR family response regulator transcription factor n=1 Tax=Chryseobacterium gambrini TaxID=373672 RepID=UPI0022F39F8F|nr:LytTR family DNA-binding domain-containing protein [Chryseobacterium gambrini]WBX99499.1 LytTR family DNA-binding domain-containing protein [Chryseobacterium gambrini]
MKAILVEDEINAQKALLKMLQLIAPEIQVLAIFDTIKDASLFLSKNTVDFIFLDIQLKDGNGFKLLQTITNRDFSLIFTTAFNDFAIKAFKFNAIDYLLKPIDPTELEEAIERAKKIKKSNQIVPVEKSFSEQKIVLKTTDRNHIIPVSSIIRLEADGAYTLFVTESQKILVSKNIKYYEDLLCEYDFVRCHQSHLVAKSHIKVLKTHSLLLTDGSEIPISHRKRKLFNSF